MRQICPQVRGIYQNNAKVDDRGAWLVEEEGGEEPYNYLVIGESTPNNEYWITDAHECDRGGNINPEKTTAEPHQAEDFGDWISDII